MQAVCTKDYGAGDPGAFERHKNAGYTWLILILTVLILLLAALKGPVLDLLGANDGSKALAAFSRECYTMILLWTIPQGFFSIASCLLFIEEKRILLAANIILYTLLFAGDIFVTISEPSMKSYMMANVISVTAANIYIIVLCFIIRRKSSKTAATALDLHPKDIKEVFFTGLPDFMEYGFVGLLYLAENNYMLYRFSESLVAGTSVFEAIENIPEVVCVGFTFLTTSTLAAKVGKLKGASSSEEADEAKRELADAATILTKGGVTGALALTIFLILTAYPMVRAFMTGDGNAAVESAVMLTISNAIAFVFYILNSELVCYYKIVGAFIPAHLVYFLESLALPLAFKVMLGELLGVTGFCFAIVAAEISAFIFNLCIIRYTAGHFPRTISDFRMDKYLKRTVNKNDADEVEA